jgi:hypothetical protein
MDIKIKKPKALFLLNQAFSLIRKVNYRFFEKQCFLSSCSLKEACSYGMVIACQGALSVLQGFQGNRRMED